jgi:ribosome-binding protein aMBF1 (putative translation factor)
MNHAELKSQSLSNPEALAAYESMDVEFSILRQMLAAREKAGLSQAQVASRMGTNATAITRLESSLGKW